MLRKQKLYVDANLKVTNSLRMRKAIVNIVNGCIEITFLKPIAHQKNQGAAWKEKGMWGLKYYPSYKSSLPRAESLVFANSDEQKLVFKNCHTSTEITDWHGRTDGGRKIDDEGRAVSSRGEVLENVYVSIILTKEEFFRLNPAVDLRKFAMSECF